MLILLPVEGYLSPHIVFISVSLMIGLKDETSPYQHDFIHNGFHPCSKTVNAT